VFVPRLSPGLIYATTMLATLAVARAPARGETPWYEGFEGPQPSWRSAGGDAPVQVLAHRRVRGEAATGEGCEHVAISAAGGTHVYFGHEVGRPRVIDELLPTVQVKSDRGGIQILAKIVLPRAKDPRSGRPITTLVHGSSYTAVGRWQQLRLDDVPQQLARRTRVLRAELRAAIDPREAYVERVLLNVYGGPGVTNVWIDDLDVGGYVGLTPGTPGPTPNAGPNRPAPATSLETAGWTASRSEPAATVHPGRIRLDGSLLLVDGRPFFPRIVQYQGESLGLLQRLGFNVVWLDRLAPVEMLDEARRLGIWLISPPPGTPEPSTPHGASVALAPIGPRYQRVLAWDLGRDLSADELDTVKQRASHVRAADRQTGRPLVCRPRSNLREYSRCVDVLIVGRSPLGTSLELSAYGTWLRERPRLPRAGSCLWTTVGTQLAPSIRRQWSGLGLTGMGPAPASCEQIRLLTYTAVAAGVRGLLFESQSPLDAPDTDTRTRALALELLNLELTLVERWAAAGDSAPPVKGSEPDVLGGVLWTDRARLLVGIWSGPGAQLVPGQSAASGVSFVVKGVPESNRAYLMIPGAIEPLRPKRVAGGTRITLDEFGLTSLVLMTEKPLVVAAMTEQTERIARRAAQLQRDLAVAKLLAVEHAHAQRSAHATGPQSVAWLGAARQRIQSSDASLGAGDYPTAYRQAQRAMRPLRLLERAHWEAAVARLPSAVSHPAAVSPATLPAYWTLIEQTVSAPPGPNVLAGGDFEDLDALLRAGWQHFRHAPPDGSAEAELVSTAARSGRYGLRLAASPPLPDDSDVLAERPPSSMTGPAVPVDAGQVVRIHGWVQVPEPITGSVDGLMIVDSLGGEPLAERVQQTAGWQEFTLYRVAPQQGELTVTFALSGFGEAWIDDVTIQPIHPGATAGPRPAVTRLPGPLRP